MKTIEINEEVTNLVPAEFKNLPDVAYKLTKTENSRPGFVSSGDTVTGSLAIINVAGLGLPGVRVTNWNYIDNGFPTYIRTSPIVEVVDKTDTTITFRTEGGVYKLERVQETTEDLT